MSGKHIPLANADPDADEIDEETGHNGVVV